VLNWSETRLSRIVTGNYRPTELELTAILAICEVTGNDYQRSLEICRTQDATHWEAPRNAIGDQLHKLTRIAELAESVIPKLLQVQSYTRATLGRSVNIPFDQSNDWISRIDYAQAILEGPKRPSCTFFVHEQALRLPVGNEDVMGQQLHNLVRLNTRNYINIRVIPASIGAYPGMGCAFMLLEFIEDVSPVVYQEDELVAHFREDPERVTSAQRVLAGLSSVALAVPESSSLIDEIATKQFGDSDEYYGNDDDQIIIGSSK
jgi:hypothetical protein